jgi:hypothetical protein
MDVNDYFAFNLAVRSAAGLATSALPHAPVRPEDTDARHGLRRLAARGLLRLADRLEPGSFS